MTVRPLTKRDRRGMGDIDGASGGHRMLPDPESVIADRHGRGLAAVVGGKIVGYVVYTQVRAGADLTTIVWWVAVAPAWQRRGIGALLLRCVEAAALRRMQATRPVSRALLAAAVPMGRVPAQVALRSVGYAVPTTEPAAAGGGDCYLFMRVHTREPRPAVAA